MSENEETNAFNISGAQLIYMTKLLSKYLGKKVYLHLFRHSFAHRGMQRGIDLRIMSKILGHSSITTTMIYVNPSEEEIKDMYKSKMEDK
jgi:site-specific recombinase XerD